NRQYVQDLGDSIRQIKDKIKNCSLCGNYTEEELCDICRDENRDKTRICVVEEPRDLIALENLKIYKGRYHILFGVISPINGVGPDDLSIKPLLQRIQDSKEKIEEVIIATNPTPEGDTTAFYLAKLLKSFRVNITRLAYGIPVGAHIDYTDSITLARSFLNRKILE
ncbi:MAG: recombination mediator RecR, partial [bacterium]|nr:recombination mediator RecR [bacterium]